MIDVKNFLDNIVAVSSVKVGKVLLFKWNKRK